MELVTSVEMLDLSERGAWLCNSKSAGTATRSSDVFDEVLGESYIWPASIPRASAIRVGDVIVIWNSSRMLGFSFVEQIESLNVRREHLRCPNSDCARKDMRDRKNLTPRYKCGKCSHETDKPIVELTEDPFFRADYSAGWVEIETEVDAETCRLLTRNPIDQHSIREIDVPLFKTFLLSLPNITLKPFSSRQLRIIGGHKVTNVRVRIGQQKFRESLRVKFGDTCAFTGPAHQQTLDAAHLYSYADIGQHHSDGGLLLRRDLHRPFDTGLITVEPTELVIDIHPRLRVIDQYSNLHGAPLQVEISDGERSWLSLHWQEFRAT